MQIFKETLLTQHYILQALNKKRYNFWLLTTNTNHFQLIFKGKLNNNTEINLFLGETNCHTSCIIMSVKKSKHDLALCCWQFFGKVHLNRCPRCVWLLWAILSPQKQFPQLFPHHLTLNLNHRTRILIHQSKATLHSLDEIECSMETTRHLR